MKRVQIWRSSPCSHTHRPAERQVFSELRRGDDVLLECLLPIAVVVEMSAGMSEFALAEKARATLINAALKHSRFKHS